MKYIKTAWNITSIFLAFALVFPTYLVGMSAPMVLADTEEIIPEECTSTVELEINTTLADNFDTPGDTSTDVYVGDDTTAYSSPHTITLYENGSWIVDTPGDTNVPGLYVERTGDGRVLIFSYGSRAVGEGREKVVGTLTFTGVDSISFENNAADPVEGPNDDIISNQPGGDEVDITLPNQVDYHLVTTTANDSFYIDAINDNLCPEVPEPVCGNSIIEDGEMCDDGGTTDGDGCSATCQLEEVQCGQITDTNGWYGEYFNYSKEHSDMDLLGGIWPDDGHGDPMGSWDTDWYADDYFRFSRIDSNLTMGEDFFPFDMALEEEDNGHDYHFGAHWRALVEGDAGVYDYTLTSDDDAWVYVNGTLVEDNAGIHPPSTKTGSTTLDAVNIVDVFFAERHVVRSHMSFEFTTGGLTITPLPEECQPSLSVCKYEDPDGDGENGENISLEGWEVGLIDTGNPVSEVETDIFELNLIGGSTKLTGSNGCALFEDLLPGTYRAVEEARGNWTPIEAQTNGVFSPVLDGLSIPEEASTTPTDSFFDVFVEVDLDYEEEKEASFYNYNIKYCGDGIVNQDWEDCDGTVGCTAQCQPEEGGMCEDLVLARVNSDNIINENAGTVTDDVFLGSTINQIPNGTWFALYNEGAFITDTDIAPYEDVEGLAVERQEGTLRVVQYGSKGATDIEHLQGTVEFYNASILDLRSDNSNGFGRNNKLEKGFDGTGIGEVRPGNDEVSTSTDSVVDYYLTTNVADDGFFTDWEIIEDCIGICGVKFNDHDLDGIQDDGDENLVGWEITLYEEIETPIVCEGPEECVAEVETTLVPIATEITTEGGYCFDDVEAGTYTVGETLQDNWVNTTPLMVEDISFDGEVTTYVDFGNAAYGLVSGLKFYDENQNHEMDDGEIGLAGWEIQLYQFPNAPWHDAPKNTPYAATTTDENGMYYFYDLPPGIYQIFEVNQEGWTQTAPWFAYEWAGSDFEEGSVVLPSSIVPDHPVAWNGTDPYSSDGKWLSAKLIKNPTMLQVIGNAMDCVFNHWKDMSKCESNASLKDIHYYSVVIDSGTAIEDAYFGNWGEDVVLGDCSDGEDNDDDGLIDELDGACHSDGDPENPDSYNPAGDEIELIITEEGQNEPDIDTLSIEVSWLTNKPATSRVVYGTSTVSDIDALAEGSPLYGYATTTDTTDLDPKVESHTVLLTDLELGATYYWRPISTASPEVVGEENSFIMEVTPVPTTQCSDGEDNDDDGKTDMEDPDCSSPEDDNESTEGGGGGGTGGCGDGCGGGGGGGVGGVITDLIQGPLGGGGGGGSFVPVSGGDTGGEVIPPVTEGPIAGGPDIVAPVSPTTGGQGGTSTGTETGTTDEEEPTDTDDEDEDIDGQLAMVGFLGFDYQCNWWTTILALIILVAGAIYVFKRHNKQTEAIAGFIIGVIALWLIGSWNCNWLLAVLAVILILLIGWDLRHRKLNK